jgi:cytoskeleton protein RodZ
MNVGARLQAAREARGVSIGDMAATLRIQARYLTAIEQNDWRALPPRPYGRGFVHAYASQVGENPDRTVREFFAQFAPPPAPVPVAPPHPTRTPHLASSGFHVPRAAVIAVLLCGVVAVIVAVVVARAVRRVPERQARSGPEIGTGGSTTPGVVGNTGSAPAASPAEPRPAPVVVDLEATGRAWVAGTVDGKRAIYRMMQPGERQTLAGQDSISLRVGNAGAIRWRVNGRPAEMMGPAGSVKSARVTPE